MSVINRPTDVLVKVEASGVNPIYMTRIIIVCNRIFSIRRILGNFKFIEKNFTNRQYERIRDLGDEIYDYSLCEGGGGGIVAVVT